MLFTLHIFQHFIVILTAFFSGITFSLSPGAFHSSIKSSKAYFKCKMTFAMQSFLNSHIRRMMYLSSFMKYCSAADGTVVKGVIAKRIPKYVELKKDKTYSWCSCGLSKKQPFCDGSHKNHPQKMQPVRFSPPKDGRFLLCRCKQTNNRPYCDLTHVKTFIPEGIRKALNIKL